MIDFLNENLIFVGVIISILCGIELWFLIFRFDRYLSFLRSKFYLSFFVKEPESRTVAIAGGLMGFVVGLTIIGVTLGLLSKAFWMAVIFVTLINFLGTLVRHKWRKWKTRERPLIKNPDLKNPARRQNKARSMKKVSRSKST